VSLAVNLGLLGFFKYYNFFLDNFTSAFSFFGRQVETRSLSIFLPVGISFYTFQTLSYTIDVYRRKLKPTRDIIAFFAFVSFFPQLVAGPIERATHLLPQFYRERNFDYARAVDGLRQVLWGLFKKIVIADNCAEFANLIFNNSASYSGSTLMLGAMFFAFQIYGDFSGYSDIAIGTSRLFGFDLMRNFAFPYFSRDMAEFWRRWHISLSTWFRDYLYIPMGGSRGTMWTNVRNIFVIFIVSGFWHGANWTFIAWGALNACYFLPLLLSGSNRRNTDIVAEGRDFPTVRELVSMATTFLLVVFAWIFFRAESIAQAFAIINRIFSPTLFSNPIFPEKGKAMWTILIVVAFMVIEWIGRDAPYALGKLGLGWKRYARYLMYYAIIVAIFYFGGDSQEFIYFQF
jgi:D-alanyl-lipoteichoic acid acyltransferase DltB (MBOAT superfamily)